MSTSLRRLAVLLLAAGCSGDATAPDTGDATAPENRAPAVSGEIPEQYAVVGGLTWTVAGSFTDPDGDSLTFAAASPDTSVVQIVGSSGAGIELAAVGSGAAEVTMTATDPGGLSASTVFRVLVDPDPRPALRALYEATGGPEWNDNGNWLTDAPLHLWAGVDVGCVRWPVNGMTVTRLDLGGNGLTGSLPPELGDLGSTCFAILDLESNALTGPIPPELGNLASLQTLVLRDNDLTGPVPSELGNLAGLGLLWLNDNDLTGPIPPELGNLASLRSLDLHGNALTGPIPPKLGNLASLGSLYLYDNDLTGPIPPELGNLASLRSLYLNDNDLTGPIPPELGNLASLTSLDLSGNALSGPIPRELGNLASLERLDLGNPELCVPDDPDFRAWLIERSAHPYPCRLDPHVRLLPRALMRRDGNGLSVPLPDDLCDPAAVRISDPAIVAAAVAEWIDRPSDVFPRCWLELAPRNPGRADVKVEPKSDGFPAVAGVVVREAIGTFGIDVVMDQPAPLGYEEAMLAAADWWSSVLDGTEWMDREFRCQIDRVRGLADELLIHAGSSDGGWGNTWAYNASCFSWSSEDPTGFNPGGGAIVVNLGSPAPGDVDVLRHEIGHVLGLVSWPPHTGLTTEDAAYFTGPRAVEAHQTGGGEPGLPGVPLQRGGHWNVDCELMSPSSCGAVLGMALDEPDGLSLAALADAGYTVDLSRATPWRRPDYAAAAVAGERVVRDVVVVEIVEPPRPGGGPPR